MSSTEPQPAPVGCEHPSVSRDEAATRPVGDVMITTPKTLPAAATVGEARALFTNPKVLSAPLVDGTAFAGLLDRDELPDTAPDDAPIRHHARLAVPTITPNRPMQEALDLMVTADVLRLVVLAEDGSTLLGLLALDHQRTGFCQGS